VPLGLTVNGESMPSKLPIVDRLGCAYNPTQGLYPASFSTELTITLFSYLTGMELALGLSPGPCPVYRQLQIGSGNSFFLQRSRDEYCVRGTA